MKAILYPRYGSPDVLQLTDVEKPTPGDNQILIRVYAAAANPLDWHFIRGSPILVRLSAGMLKPKNPTLGADLAGRVEMVGRNVTAFKPGDAVLGSVGVGAFAEYVCAHEKNFVIKPANLSFETAAAAPIVGITALQGLRDSGQLKAGQTVLVNGAAGGVGTFAVQIAKSYGAQVTGVCSSRNLEMVRSLGADQVVDYTREDFTRTGQRYDLIYDAIGNRSASDYRRALKPGGQCVIVGFSSLARILEQVIVGSLFSGDRKIGLMGMARIVQDDLQILAQMMESGKLVPVIDRVYPLNQTAEAIRHLETGRARGKIIISVASD